MQSLKIYFTSDIHGYFYPTDYASTEEKPLGLFKLENTFERDGNTLVLDGGDVLQGSPFTAWTARRRLRPHPCAQALNLGGYQYVALGNHDFNFGLDALGDYLRDLNAVCLCCNIRDRGGKLPVRPWAVHTLENGLRVGLVGACTPFVRRWEKPQTVALLEFDEPLPAIRRSLEEMRPHADVKVLIYHGGFECDLKTGETLSATGENQACAICREMDFDLVLTGHQHLSVEGVDICGTHAAQPAGGAAQCVRADIFVEKDGAVRVQSRLLPPAGAPLQAGVAALAPLEAQVQAWLDAPAGRLDVPLPFGDHLESALHGCLLANFINSVQLDASGADISACSLPNKCKGLAADATVRDVVSTYVYANTLRVVRMDGRTLRRYIERTAEYFCVEDGVVRVSDRFLRPKVEHYNYDYFSGLDYVIDLRRDVGARVTSMRRNGREIEPGDVLRVCLNSYRATGTGGYDMLSGLAVEREILTDVSELILAYIERRGNVVVDKRRYLTVVSPSGEEQGRRNADAL